MSNRTRTLVVDDNEQLLQMMEMLLEGEDHEVTVSTSPLRAAMLLRENRYDLLITDMRMPVLSGRELVREARQVQANETIPVVMMSGQAREEFEGVSDIQRSVFLNKPFSSADLMDAVKRVSAM